MLIHAIVISFLPSGDESHLIIKEAVWKGSVGQVSQHYHYTSSCVILEKLPNFSESAHL